MTQNYKKISNGLKKNKVVLIICDGLGYNEEKENNAVEVANTPNFDYYKKNYPFATLLASGEAIGLPEGQQGTSEANHLVIGSGRIIYQNLVKINKAVKNGDLINNPAIVEAINHVKKYNSVLHIKGLISDGGVHSHINHIKELLKCAKTSGVKNVSLHLYTDGRDTPPKSALSYIEDLENFMKTEDIGRIATIGGRYWGMDRDNNKERVEKHFIVMTRADGPKFKSAKEVIESNYEKDITDEFIEPAYIETETGELGCIQSNDAVIFANFRSDRAREITKRFLDEKIDNMKFVAMTQYDDNLDVRVAFPPESIDNTLSEVIARNNLKQLKVTETEKFTHLTFFFNAQRYKEEKNETRILIPSNSDIKTHDIKPEMKINEITEELVRAIGNNEFDFIATNLTNCDMVGHTGNFDAIVKACEYVDSAIGKIVDVAIKNNYTVIITADHGNAEQTFDKASGQKLTSHTLNPVPFYLISDSYKNINRNNGDLSDIAPTILKIMDLEIPSEMTGRSFV